MSKRPSLFAADTKPPTSLPAPMPAAPEAGPAARKHTVAKTREGKRNATTYLDPEALMQLKLLAVREDSTVQALLIEGINEVFAKRGLSRIA